MRTGGALLHPVSFLPLVSTRAHSAGKSGSQMSAAPVENLIQPCEMKRSRQKRDEARRVKEERAGNTGLGDTFSERIKQLTDPQTRLASLIDVLIKTGTL